MNAWDLIIKILAIVVPIFMTIIVGLLAYAMQQTIGRVMDKVNSVQNELGQHKESCEKVDKQVLQSRLDTVEKEVDKFRAFAHWVVESMGRIAGKLDVTLPDRPK